MRVNNDDVYMFVFKSCNYVTLESIYSMDTRVGQMFKCCIDWTAIISDVKFNDMIMCCLYNRAVHSINYFIKRQETSAPKLNRLVNKITISILK